jgi:DNA-binding CsgD family transcriptional regulator
MKVAKNVRAIVNSEGAVLRDLRRGGTFSLNPMGAKIWQLLQQGCDTEKIIEQISADFRASRETVENDVRSFIEKLEKQGLIVREEKAAVAG